MKDDETSSELSELKQLFQNAKEGIQEEAERRSISWLKCFQLRLADLSAEISKPKNVQALGEDFEDSRQKFMALFFKVHAEVLKNPYASRVVKGTQKTTLLKELDRILPPRNISPP